MPIRQLPGWNCHLNGGFGEKTADRSWPGVLGGVRAELQPLKIPGFGKRRLTGPDAYSPYRPLAACQEYTSKAVGHEESCSLGINR